MQRNKCRSVASQDLPLHCFAGRPWDCSCLCSSTFNTCCFHDSITTMLVQVQSTTFLEVVKYMSRRSKPQSQSPTYARFLQQMEPFGDEAFGVRLCSSIQVEQGRARDRVHVAVAGLILKSAYLRMPGRASACRSSKVQW